MSGPASHRMSLGTLSSCSAGPPLEPDLLSLEDLRAIT